MRSIKATLSIELNVECPHCESYIDLVTDTDINDEGYLFDQIMPKGKVWSDEHEKFECTVVCPECKNKFDIKGVNW